VVSHRGTGQPKPPICATHHPNGMSVPRCR
jgi:hypothetical protein